MLPPAAAPGPDSQTSFDAHKRYIPRSSGQQKGASRAQRPSGRVLTNLTHLESTPGGPGVGKSST